MPTTAAERAAVDSPADRPRSFSATFADAPASVGDMAYVLYEFDGGQFLHGPCTWQPRVSAGGNAMIPKKGDACAVIDDDDGELHIISWWDPAATELPGSGPGVLVAHIFSQNLAANPWTINHGLGRLPAGLEVFDQDGNKVEATVTNPDNMTTVITFLGAMSGKVTYI